MSSSGEKEAPSKDVSSRDATSGNRSEPPMVPAPRAVPMNGKTDATKAKALGAANPPDATVGAIPSRASAIPGKPFSHNPELAQRRQNRYDNKQQQQDSSGGNNHHSRGEELDGSGVKGKQRRGLRRKGTDSSETKTGRNMSNLVQSAAPGEDVDIVILGDREGTDENGEVAFGQADKFCHNPELAQRRQKRYNNKKQQQDSSGGEARDRSGSRGKQQRGLRRKDTNTSETEAGGNESNLNQSAAPVEDPDIVTLGDREGLDENGEASFSQANSSQGDSFSDDLEAGPSEVLVEATLVDQDRRSSKPLVLAHAVDEVDGIFLRKRTLAMLCFLFLVSICLAVGIPCGLGACSGGSNNADIAPATTMSPSVIISLAPTPTSGNQTFAPTFAAPTAAPTPYIIDGLPPYTLSALSDPESPQSKAYAWVQNDPLLLNYTNERLLQRFALVTFFYSTNGEMWEDKTGWLSYLPEEDECTWFTKRDAEFWPEYDGPTCSENGSYHYLSPWENEMTGSLPKELALLSSLIVLDVSSGRIEGSIPETITNLSQLEVLWLGDNDMTGTINSELGLMSNLQIFVLNRNQLRGSLPSELGQLSKLRKWESVKLDSLEGPLPSELGLLSSLKELRLDECRLSSAIPTTIGMLTNLQELHLQDNLLTSLIPTELGQLSSLEILRLDETFMEGSIPWELGLLGSLKELRLNDCQFSSTIPAIIGMLTTLRLLYLNGNMLTSLIPTELNQLSLLEMLRLDENDLEGNVGNLTLSSASLGLKQLDITGNAGLTGTLHQELCPVELLRFTCSEQLCGCDCSCLG
ncbi:Leucine Rich Repeat [Seminavis robusta]|uniref:Leucine Rich Repeat n=1 Tax=Seminavis robusta TaxID=568900 RepID=A0A9N8HWD0_9STRA|nr:Leucine Rich Repeat [Seminavis robusta]|eukprot:Sro2147_g316510.1 Leucine Rich Repeat (808) ;mRNA; f:12534-15270